MKNRRNSKKRTVPERIFRALIEFGAERWVTLSELAESAFGNDMSSTKRTLRQNLSAAKKAAEGQGCLIHRRPDWGRTTHLKLATKGDPELTFMELDRSLRRVQSAAKSFTRKKGVVVGSHLLPIATLRQLPEHSAVLGVVEEAKKEEQANDEMANGRRREV